MIVGIYKPSGPTSHDIIGQVRRITGERRVGHAGTLDPMASGVLVVAITRESTKSLTEIVNHDKHYEASITLGGVSTTDDAEGTITTQNNFNDPLPTSHEIESVLTKFVGEIKQIPPIYSAINVGGAKSYDLARKGHAVYLGPHDVVIHSIKLIEYEWPIMKIEVECGPGVYIRSIARDIGQNLGVGGYLSSLKRTKVGEYLLENCLTIEQFEKLWHEK